MVEGGGGRGEMGFMGLRLGVGDGVCDGGGSCGGNGR